MRWRKSQVLGSASLVGPAPAPSQLSSKMGILVLLPQGVGRLSEARKATVPNSELVCCGPLFLPSWVRAGKPPLYHSPGRKPA